MLTASLDLPAEVTLDPSIQFHQGAQLSYPPQNIFLTGATGFVGVYLLVELLRQTTAEIYCLVRAPHREAAQERLKQHLKIHHVEQETSRIIPVVGDLSQPHLALSQEIWHHLATHIDVIYHNAAQVNAFYPYSKLKATNVCGTQEILRLAGLTRLKPVHFVSTLAVFFSPTASSCKPITETDDPKAELIGGYKQSKWVAEQIILLAQQRGLPSCIYRTSRVIGHSKTGIHGNTKDFFYRLLKGCIQLGYAPSLTSCFNLVPVDYISQAIVHLSQQETFLGKIFHLAHPQTITWHELLNQIRVLGYDLTEISYEQWIQKLEAQKIHSQDAEFYSSLSLLLRSPHSLFMEKPHFDLQNTLQCLEQTSIRCPPLNSALWSTYFHQSGFLPPKNVHV